jgi:HD-GYP domain
MTSDKPYRQAFSREQTLAELKFCAGTQFDPEIVDAFCTNILPAIMRGIHKLFVYIKFSLVPDFLEVIKY